MAEESAFRVENQEIDSADELNFSEELLSDYLTLTHRT